MYSNNNNDKLKFEFDAVRHLIYDRKWILTIPRPPRLSIRNRSLPIIFIFYLFKIDIVVVLILLICHAVACGCDKRSLVLDFSNTNSSLVVVVV